MGENPSASVGALVTVQLMKEELRNMLPMMNANTATLKIVMQKLAVRFGMEFADLKAQWRPQIKALLPNLLELCKNANDFKDSSANEDTDAEKDNENEKEAALRLSKERVIKKRNAVVDSSDEEEEAARKGQTSGNYRSSSNDEDAAHKKRRTTSRKSKVAALPRKKAKTAIQSDSPGLASLKELGRAAGVLNPQVYKYLKSANSTEEAEEYLRERLNIAGITFYNTYPTSRDICAAKKKHAKEKELEGIDTSLIISSGRPRRGGVRQISYKENSVSGDEDDVEMERDDEGNCENQVTASDSDTSEATF